MFHSENMELDETNLLHSARLKFGVAEKLFYLGLTPPRFAPGYECLSCPSGTPLIRAGSGENIPIIRL